MDTPTQFSTHRDARIAFRAALERTRRRYALRRVLEGAALAIVIIAVVVLGGIAIMSAVRFELEVVDAVRGVAYLAIAVALAMFVVVPLFKRMSTERFARYLETHHQDLDALVLSAVDADEHFGDGDVSAELSLQVMHEAARELAAPPIARMETPRVRRAGFAALAVLIALVGLGAFGPTAFRHGMALLFAPPHDRQAANPYALLVEPGDVEVLEGAEVRIAAEGSGYTPDEVTLFVQTDMDGQWSATPLARGQRSGQFEEFLFDIAKPFSYRVSDGRLNSEVHRVSVIPRPVAKRIDLLYQYPERSGRVPQLVEDGGDIDAVRGTTVEVRVTPSHPTAGGALVIDGERRIRLRETDGELRASIELVSDGRYRIELDARGYGMTPASPEHAIIARVDQLPSLALLSPGRDVKVTRIEEIAIEAEATDDVAVRALELVMSVNGAAEEVVALGGGSESVQNLRGTVELALENRILEPGDLISYYVRTHDADGDEGRLVTSDIYFMDVRPFDVSYRRGRGGGRSGGAQQRGGDQNLSAQQRTLLVALFKLARDRDVLDDDVVKDRVQTLAGAQTRIRTRVDAIVRRLGTRSIVNLNPGYRRMAKELPEASKSMMEVEALLAVRDVEGAVPAARTALLHLQRADAAVREVRVAQARQGGGGGAANDLSNLFRLEMDRFRNQYEDVRRGDWRPRSRQMDDTLERLKELAERQLREMERARALGRNGDNDAQRALAAEVEKLVRELERLSRKRPSEALKNSMQALEQAAEAMRRSAGKGDARAGADALERLRAARRHLDGEGTGRLSRDTSEARREAEALADAQSQIERAVRQGQRGRSAGAPQSPGPSSQGSASQSQGRDGRTRGDGSRAEGESSQGQASQGQASQGRGEGDAREGGRGGDGDGREGNGGMQPGELIARKESLADALEALEQRLDALSGNARQEGQEEAARALRRSAAELRAAEATKRIRQSAERLSRQPDSADPEEEAGFSRALDALKERVAEASTRIGEPRGARIARVLDSIRGTLRGADRTREQIAEAMRRQSLPRPGGGGGGRGNGPGPGGRADAYDLDAIRRAMESRNGEILSLAEGIAAEQPDMRGELEGLLDALDGVRGAEAANAEQLAERHAALISALQAVEQRLRREHATEAPTSAAIARAEAPLQQRDIVDEYYRNLSERE